MIASVAVIALLVALNLAGAGLCALAGRKYAAAAEALERADEARDRQARARDDIVRLVSERLGLIERRVTYLEEARRRTSLDKESPSAAALRN